MSLHAIFGQGANVRGGEHVRPPVNMFLKFLIKQLRHFFRRNLALAPRHTNEAAYKTLVRPQLEYAAPIWHPCHDTETEMVEKVQKTAAMWTCRRWRNQGSVGDMLDEHKWSSLKDRRVKSSLIFFYKINSGTMSNDKDKYLTTTHNLRRTRASHDSQYTIYMAYSDALKNFFPVDYPIMEQSPFFGSLIEDC